MPVDLTNSINVTSELSVAASRLRVLEHVPDAAAKRVQIVLGREDAGVVSRIPGILAIENLTEQRSYVVGGHQITVPAGNHFDTVQTYTVASLGLDANATVYDVTKAAMYRALADVFGLAGVVS